MPQAEQADVVIYCSGYCPYCTRAKYLLQSKSVVFTEISLDTEPHRRDEMIERSAGLTSVPQIFINAQHIGGCDDLYALESQGKLDSLLAKT